MLRAHLAMVLALVDFLLRVALALDQHCKRLPRRIRRWRGSMRQDFDAWRVRHGLPPSRPPLPRHLRSSNRTPNHLKRKVMRLQLEQLPQLGAGQLRFLLARVAGVTIAREAIRKIVLRRQDLLGVLGAERRKRPRRIRVTGLRQLWGADPAVVFVLGVFPVWLLGVVDYHGSRLMALEPLRWPTSAEIARVLEGTIARFGAPHRLLTDNGSNLLAPAVAEVLDRHGVRHICTRPAHPWTNGRIERIWRTFKETIRLHFWMLASRAHLLRVGLPRLLQPVPPPQLLRRQDSRRGLLRPADAPTVIGRVSYFDGSLSWYRFG